MAEALVSVVLEQLGSMVIHEFAEEVKRLVGVKEEVRKLTKTLTMIAAVLEDAEGKQVKDKAVKLWLEDLKDISYDANDILDEWFTRSLISRLQQPDVNAPIGKKVQFHLNCLRSCFKPVGVRHELAIKIRDLNEQLGEIVKMKDTFNLNPTEGKSHEEPRIITSSFIDISAAFGRDDDVDIIVSKLLSESSHPNLPAPVISIVGTGGFGKTTLAQMILKQKQVIANFEKTMWVCVSEPFDIEKVAKQIIELATGSAAKAVGWEAVLTSLSKAVQGKQFLLVLDDVWSYNEEEWSQLKLSLNCGGTQSRIIVTTRDEEIGMKMGSTFTHRLGRLSEEASLLLFQRIAFLGREHDFEKYEDIARDITEKCKGVPLAVKTLAGLVHFKRSKQEWRDILESDMWNDPKVKEGFLPSLMLSYYALPSELKPCFLYCAIFLKDAMINKDELIKLWMAQGFLGSSGADGSKDLETIGEDYFNNLAMRSFFQGFEKDDEGNIITCMMHDLVHDFAQFLSKSESFLLEEGKVLSSSVKIRHLGLGYSKIDNPSIYEECCLRTLRSSNNPIDMLRLSDWDTCHLFNKLKSLLSKTNKLKYLRALSLHGCILEEVPDEVGKLLHLRFLDLSWNGFQELPEAICGLPNLQTLILFNCMNLCKLPKGLGELSNLRHLDTRETGCLLYYPPGIGNLGHLRTLKNFIVGDDRFDREEGCKLKDLKLLNHLQGSLTVNVRKRVTDVNEGKEAELNKKVKLRCLRLKFPSKAAGDEEDSLRMQSILEDFQPHRNLESLYIEHYHQGFKLPFWISSLSNLVTLEVYNCSQCLQLPAMGRLASLENLTLNVLPSLKHIGSEWYGLDNIPNVGSGGSGSSMRQQKVVIFPKLKSLKLMRCDKLEEWDMPLQNHLLEYFPNLSDLLVYCCKVLRVLPAFGMLKSLETLTLEGIKCLSLDLLGISSGDGESASAGTAIYPALKDLTLCGLQNWGEEEEILSRDNGENGIAAATIMPCLTALEISICPKLKVLPEYLFPEVLENLEIWNCSQLTGTQPCFPMYLKSLLWKGDLGVVTSSLFSFGVSPHNNYPNLKTLHIYESPLVSLPEGFNLLTGIQTLKISDCEFLDFLPEELKHLTMLEELTIDYCPLLEKHFTDEVISQLLQRV